MRLNLKNGLVESAEYKASPNCDERPNNEAPSVIIVHCISLPPGEYSGDCVERFFLNQLSSSEHPYFESMAHLTVSAHFFVRRSGQLIQFVPVNKRAWHAGESQCLQRGRVNDFSIGIELEGLDTDPNGFTEQQYKALRELVTCVQQQYPAISNNVYAHSDIAPGRKPDPGPYFDWSKLEACF